MSDLFNRGGLQQDTGRIADRWGQDDSTLLSATDGFNTVANTLLTVSAGKIFYLTGIYFYNTSLNETLWLMDSAVAKITLQGGIANTNQAVELSTPLAFITSVVVDASAGAGNITIVGWEE